MEMICARDIDVLYISGSCPSNCSGNGKCLKNGNCECANGFTGIDCSTGEFQLKECLVYFKILEAFFFFLNLFIII